MPDDTPSDSSDPETPSDSDAPTERAGDDEEGVGEGVYAIGGDDSDEPSPGDRGYVEEKYALGEDREPGTESRSTATLSDEARAGAKEAINDEKVSRGALTKSTTSQQGPDEDLPMLVDARREYIQPPYDPKLLADLAQKSGTHARCVDAKAQGVAGHGFDVVAHPRHADIDDGGSGGADSPPENIEEARQFWYGSGTTFQLGPNRQLATPEGVLENVWWDYEGVGWGCLEFLVNRSAEPTGLAHIPAHRVRKRADEPGYVELDRFGRIRQFFSEAGLRYDTSADDDDPDQTFVDRWTGETADTKGGVSEVANEILFIQNYSPLTPFYGLPDVVPEIQTIVADLAARRYNSRFFENDGVPRFIVTIEGGQLTDRAFSQLQDELKKLSQEENSHRGMLLEAQKVVNQQTDGSNVNVSVETLTVGEQEDASFIDFRKENEHDVAKVHSVPPVVHSRTENVNYSNARQQRQEFAQDTIRPRQQTLAARIHRTIHTVLLNAPGVTLDFNLRGGENRLREAEIAKTKREAAGDVLKVNELRKMIGYGPLTTEGGDPDPTGEMLVAELQSTQSQEPAGLASGGEQSDSGSESGRSPYRERHDGEDTNPYAIERPSEADD